MKIEELEKELGFLRDSQTNPEFSNKLLEMESELQEIKLEKERIQQRHDIIQT